MKQEQNKLAVNAACIPRMSINKRSQSPAPSGSGRAPAAASGMDAKVVEKQLPQTGAWHSGIFDICSSGPMVCIASFCCPAVQHGLNAYGLELKKSTQAAHGLEVAHLEMIKYYFVPPCGTGPGIWCAHTGAQIGLVSLVKGDQNALLGLMSMLYSGSCLSYLASISFLCCSANAFLVHKPFRKSVRASYGINESDQSCGNDFVTTCLCNPCHLIQAATQINKVRVPNVRD